MREVIEVNGVRYQSESNGRNDCIGCAAENNRTLCRSLPSCTPYLRHPIQDIIFKRIEIHEAK